MYLCSESKGTDQLRSYCAADLLLCFHICKNRFSHEATHSVLKVCDNQSLGIVRFRP